MKSEGTSSSFKLQFSCACVSSQCFLLEELFQHSGPCQALSGALVFVLLFGGTA